MVCTFFGHSDCYGLDKNLLQSAIEELIINGVDKFYVGNHGHFDSTVYRCLIKLKERHQHISISVVLAYLPTQKNETDIYQGLSLYPEGLEACHPKFAIVKRNKWMIDKASYCLCYVNNTCGGAYKFACQAKRCGLTVINLGSAEL